jgi:Spy/CpxP family protein refolding chaperone
MESNDLNRTKARLVIVAIFVFGFVGGALSMNLYTKNTTKAGDGAQPRHYFFTKLTEQCNLTDEQQTRVRAICDDTFNKFHDIGKQVEPQMDQARHDGRDRIRAVLTKDQLPRFEELLTEMDKKRQERSEHK